MVAMYTLSRSTTTAGSFDSQKAVKPRISVKRIVTIWRLPVRPIFCALIERLGHLLADEERDGALEEAALLFGGGEAVNNAAEQRADES